VLMLQLVHAATSMIMFHLVIARLVSIDLHFGIRGTTR
jgi:hypothetical protein